MRLSTAIVSSDTNPVYLDFFPTVHEAWRRLIGVRCILMLVGDVIPESLVGFADDIVLCRPGQGVHPAFHAQCIRLLAPQLVGETNGAVVISDIDMLPLSRSYFLDAVSDADSTDFVVYRHGALPPETEETAICYNAAEPRTWAEIFGRVTSSQEAGDMVAQWSSAIDYEGTHGGRGWVTDQRLLHAYLSAFDHNRILRRSDQELGFRRLDRYDIPYHLSWAQRALASRGDYTDYHMKRPPGQFKALNEEVAALVPTQTIRSPLVPFLRFLEELAPAARIKRLMARLLTRWYA